MRCHKIWRGFIRVTNRNNRALEERPQRRSDAISTIMLASVDYSESSAEILDLADEIIRYVALWIKCLAGEVCKCRVEQLDRRRHRVDWIACSTATI